MSSAQEEFDQLVSSNRDKFSSHPEDRNVSDDESEDDSDKSIVSEPEDSNPSNMAAGGPATYHVPRTVYDANTGPKGVIADAQAFERARKSSFRNTFRSKDHARGSSKSSKDDANLLHNSNPPHGSASDDDEDRFLRQWREERMQELQGRNGRRNSPWRKVYGSVDTVDAVGYLDAIEKVPSDAVVVVCLNDPDSHASAQVEDCLDVIARRQPAIHFVKMHYEIAEMDHIKPPALLAYRDGDVFATIVDIAPQIPKGQPCTADTLEDLLKSYRVL